MQKIKLPCIVHGIILNIQRKLPIGIYNNQAIVRVHTKILIFLFLNQTLRPFFWAPITCNKTDGQENIQNFTLEKFVTM